MVGKITPLVQVAAWRSWTAASSLFLVGAVLASAASGWVFGAAGGLLGLARLGPALLIVAAVLLAEAVLDSGLTPWQGPHLARQTPSWFECQFGITWSSLLWGLDLGLGWTTQSCFGTYFGAVALVIWAGAPAWGALALGAYGVGKGL